VKSRRVVEYRIAITFNGEGRNYTIQVEVILFMMNQRPDTVAAEPPQEEVLAARNLMQVIRRRAWLIVLVVIVLVGVAVGSSLVLQPRYEASIKILIGQKGDANPSNYTSIVDLQQLTLTMSEAVASRPVARSVIDQLDLQGVTAEDLLDRLKVDEIQDTQFIEVSYVAYSPQRAQEVVNTVGEVFSREVSEVSPRANSVTATVWEEASIPEAPIGPNPVQRGILALVLGLIFGIGLAILFDILDDSWQSPEEAEQISGIPTMGVVPTFEATKDAKKGRS